MKREEITTGLLPSDYRQLEYIESTGTQWIDSGFKSNQDTRVVCEYTITQAQSYFPAAICPFGSRYAYNNNQYLVMGMVNRATSMVISYGNYSRFTETTILNRRVSIDINKNVATYKVGTNNYSYIFAYSNFQQQGNCYIFKCNFYNETPGTNGLDPNQTDGHIRLFLLQIYDNGYLVRDYIPALRTSDSKPGLYDTVNNQFYTNQGSGEFLYA